MHGAVLWILFVFLVIPILLIPFHQACRCMKLHLGPATDSLVCPDMLMWWCRFYLLFGLITAHYSVFNTQHIHHFYLGWSIALFAEFNHPISAITLAISMGVFTQGVGVYGFASMFEDSGCFTASGGNQMSCDFTSSSSSTVSIKVCPQTAGGLTHSCFYTNGF